MNRILLGWLLLLPAIVFSQDFTSQFPCHKQTAYFDFYYLRESPRIPKITRFADGFVRLVNRDFFKADFDYPIRVLVFEDREQFKQFLIRQLHIADPPNFGVYVYRYKFFATYEDSGLGTFAHEILHPLVERNLKDRPQWAMEGIPTFFEKFYGYWQGGELTAFWGYQNPWRIQQLRHQPDGTGFEASYRRPEGNRGLQFGGAQRIQLAHGFGVFVAARAVQAVFEFDCHTRQGGLPDLF
jgi:hypothetical protein